jgi:hypothetical protein
MAASMGVSLSNVSLVAYSPAGKNVIRGIIRIRYQETAFENKLRKHSQCKK